MSAGIEITIYLTCALVAGVAAAVIAGMKGRHTGFWMTGSFLFPPLILVLLFLVKRASAPGPRPQAKKRDDLEGIHAIR